jgi:hypothetical protein
MFESRISCCGSQSRNSAIAGCVPSVDMDRHLALLGTLAIVTGLAGCAAPSPSPVAPTQQPTESAPAPPSPVATGEGTVVGAMYRCFGVQPALAGSLTRAPGNVAVFRGSRPGLPFEVVQTGGEYSIALPPGEYELVGHWTGSNLAPPTARVSVSDGRITRQDLVYRGCL